MKIKVLISSLLLSLGYSNHLIASEENGISEVGGQIVKDGDRHEYLLDYKRWNVAVNPFGVLSDIYSISGSYAFHKNFALKLDGSYSYQTNASDDSESKKASKSDSVSELAVSVPIYFQKAYTGVSLETGMLYRTIKYDGKRRTEFGPQLLLGYSWMWDSGLNVGLGLGAARNLVAKDRELVGNGYFRVGYAF